MSFDDIDNNEVRSVFGLLGATKFQQLNIQQLNELANSLEGLCFQKKLEQLVSKQKESRNLHTPPKQSPRKSANFMITTQSSDRRNSSKKIVKESPVKSDKAEKTPRGSSSETVEPLAQPVQSPEKEKPDALMESFPNEQNILSYDEFVNIYTNTLNNDMVQDDLLLKCFSVFDHDE